MTAAGARRLAWAVWTLAVALIVAQLVFAILNGGTAASGSETLDYALTVPLLVLPTIGRLVASRRPGHPVGWVLLASGLLLGFSALAEGWAMYALFTEPDSLPAPGEAAAVSSALFLVPLFAMPVLLFLLFPDGHLPSPRWRLVLWVGAISLTATTLETAVAERLSDAPFEGVENPLGGGPLEAASGSVGWIGWPGLAVAVILAATGMILRLRRSRGRQRQQLKWMAAAAALFALTTTVSVVSYFAGAESLGAVILVLGYAAIPIAAGAAILRHRIYDIDLVINRALVYGSLTALLAGTYVGLALLLSLALEPVTSGSDLAIALSTLGVAASYLWR